MRGDPRAEYKSDSPGAQALKSVVVSDVLRNWLESDQVVRRSAPIAEEEIQKVESEIGNRIPEPLRQLLLTSGSPEGFLGESYIAFFNATDITACWREAQQMAVGFVPFASNGGGDWYGYDSRSPLCPFVLLPAVGMDWDDAMLLGATWNDFLGVLKNGNLFERKYAPL
jgi:SMI1 / KNR4 family (SUKH-1)